MNNKNSKKNSSVIHISGFENTKKLCRILSHEGTIKILNALQEKPKLFRELFAELGLPSTTFETALKDLNKTVNIIRKTPIVADNRDTHQYVLNLIGKELIRFIRDYERFMALSIPQQKVLEIEKTK